MTLSAADTLTIHDLVMRHEDELWIVGRRDGGEFVEVPGEAVTFIRALQERCTVGEAAQRVFESYGHEIEAEELAGTLVELEFASTGDGDADEASSPAERSKPSLPWIKEGFARRVFSAPTYVGVALLLATGTVAAVARGSAIPSYHSYFLSSSPTFNVAWNTLAVLICLAIHETLHLTAARADGVPARLGFGTRLQFLVAQTNVNGLWCASRRTRFRVYIAGMMGDLSIAAVCSIALGFVSANGFTCHALQALMLSRLMTVAYEFCIFMKTDMYFVVQELMRCKNLYADGWAYLRYAGRRAVASIMRRDCAVTDPRLELPAHERRAVKVYACFMLLGSAISLSLFAFYALPVTITLFVSAVERLVNGVSSGNFVKATDGLLVLCVEGAFQAVFIKVFITKHGKRIAAFVRRADRKVVSHVPG